MKKGEHNITETEGNKGSGNPDVSQKHANVKNTKNFEQSHLNKIFFTN